MRCRTRSRSRRAISPGPKAPRSPSRKSARLRCFRWRAERSMADTTGHSIAILVAAGRSLAVQRAGGLHRRALAPSIGKGAAELKARHLANKVARIVAATVAVIIGAGIVGGIIGGIGFWGLMIATVAIAAAVFTFGAFPKLKVP